MRVLVVFGSKRGGTAGIAHELGKTLRQAGHEVDIQPAHEPDGLRSWDAVVVGGALYAGRWQRSARRFVQRHVDELERLPVWFFSSGPLDDSASKGKIEPTAQVRRLMERVHAREHITFGGCLPADASGLIARAMVKQGRGGDFRDMDAVRTWGLRLASELTPLEQRRPVVEMPQRISPRSLRHLLGGLCLFTGLTAAVGGVELVLWPIGAFWEPPLELTLLQYSPFRDFFLPGLLLFSAVGVLNLLSGWLALRRQRFGELVAFAGGSSLTIWILSQIVLLRNFSWLQPLYLVVGFLSMALALWLWNDRRTAVRSHVEVAPVAALAN